MEVEGEGVEFVYEAIHEDEQDLTFGDKVLVEAPNGDVGMEGEVFNGGVFVAVLAKD